MPRWSTADEIEGAFPSVTRDVLNTWRSVGIVHPRREPVYGNGRLVGALETYDASEIEQALAHESALLLTGDDE